MTFSFLAYESVNLISIEIGCLGHFMPDTIAQVANACKVAKKTIRSQFEQAARIAVSLNSLKGDLLVAELLTLCLVSS